MEERKMVVGLPRAMLYFRFRILWRAFFEELGVPVAVSGPTDREVLERGTDLAIDEACLSLKIYLGHVDALVGKCSHILVPRVSNFGRHRNMCTRFEALPDLTRNVFRNTGQKFLTYNVDVLEKKKEEDAFLEIGQALGYPVRTAKRAYKQAKKAELAYRKAKAREQDTLCREKGLKILIAAHSYVIEDAYVGRTVTEYLKQAGVVSLRADLADWDAALECSQELSGTCKWEMSREILGGIAMYENVVDGIILLSAFPCGPDSMVNELVTRRVKGVPLLNLVLDSQTGTAGVETRLESFIDIIRFKKGAL